MVSVDLEIHQFSFEEGLGFKQLLIIKMIFKRVKHIFIIGNEEL